MDESRAATHSPIAPRKLGNERTWSLEKATCRIRSLIKDRILRLVDSLDSFVFALECIVDENTASRAVGTGCQQRYGN